MRDLNRLVATAIFAAPDVELSPDTPCPECSGEMRYCGARSWCSTCGEWRYEPYSDYCGDLGIAWRVVEKMRGDGWKVVVVIDGEEAAVTMFAPTGGAFHGESSQKCLEENICVAALRAVGAWRPREDSNLEPPA